MNTDLINKITKNHLKSDHIEPFRVGDTVSVDNVIRDGDKQRIQVFKGLVIAIKGSGTGKTFTVRKISYGIGIEKIFPFYSPNVAAVKIEKYGKPRRSKLYFLRERVGKLALKVKPGNPRTQAPTQVIAEPEVAETAETESTESAE